MPRRAAATDLVLMLVANLIVASAMPAAPVPHQPSADTLARRGTWGAAIAEPDGKPGAIVRRVAPDGPAARAGLAPDDRLLRVDGRAIDDGIAWSAADNALRGERAVQLLVRRAERSFETRLLPTSVPLEQHDCCETTYGVAQAVGGPRVRTIVTRPRGARGALPAVLFAGWLSCDSVELPAEGGDGWAAMLRKLVRESGFVVMRVDKPGVADSEGICGETDHLTELAAYRAALATLVSLPDVDPKAVFIFGGSLGGAAAPLLAQDGGVRAVAVWGTFANTWLEHMLALERRRLTLSGETPSAISDKLRGYAELHTLFLARQMTPGQVLQQRPDLRSLWYDAPGHLYGRPAAFHHQLQQLNVAAAWERVQVPVLSVRGEYDWIMSREDQESLVAAVNRNAPGRARHVEVPRVDHHFSAYDDAKQAFAGEAGKIDLTGFDLILAFLREQVANVNAAADAQAAFASGVKPLLLERCAPCHAPGGTMYGGSCNAAPADKIGCVRG